MTDRRPQRCEFVPPWLLQRLAETGSRPALTVDPAARAAERTLQADAQLRAARDSSSARLGSARKVSRTAWSVSTAKNTEDLPGSLLRRAGDPPSADPAVNEAATGAQAALDLFREVYDRSSYDGAGAEVVMTVHYGTRYDNAFWNGTQLVFGDGDGVVFDRFTKPVDVLGHELTHAVTEHTAGLTYSGQSGALNESMSDVFGICAKQRLLGQTAAEADWLIGDGIFLPDVKARALRDMAHPGTAYDDPRLGKDPQVGDLAHYVDTSDDNGGVHINSGIPNRAFYLAATAIGGVSAEGAGAIWYAALTGRDVGADTDFAGFAAATVTAAGAHANAVRQAWTTVGVTPGPPPASGSSSSGSGAGQVVVRRSGGFAGLTRTGEIDLHGDDPRAPLARQLVNSADLSRLARREPSPDAFSYTFCLPDCDDVTVGEHDLTADLRRLAVLLLGER